MKRMTFLLALVALVAIPQAFANDATDVVDKWLDPGDVGYANGTGLGTEINLYDIVNQVRAIDAGAGFTWNNYAGGATSTAGLSGLEFSQDDIWRLINGESFITSARARYAGYTQEFGWYDPSEGANPTLHKMFDVLGGNPNDVFDNTENAGMTWDSTADAAFTALLSSATQASPFNFGFYDDAPVAVGFVEYSEEARNADFEDHMIAFLVDQRVSGSLTQFTYLLAWEDLQHLGDIDYNDLVVEMVITSAITPFKAVPEPCTLALLGLGAAGAMLRKRFIS